MFLHEVELKLFKIGMYGSLLMDEPTPGDLVEIIMPLEAGDNIRGVLTHVHLSELGSQSFAEILTSRGMLSVHPLRIRKINEAGQADPS